MLWLGGPPLRIEGFDPTLVFGDLSQNIEGMDQRSFIAAG